MKKIILCLSLVFALHASGQQKSVLLHSHNDYKQEVPFYYALGNGLKSIEVDIVYKDKSLFVAHEKESISNNRTLESLYLEPLAKSVDIYKDHLKGVQFLIDFKNSPNQSMEELVRELEKYQDIIYANDLSFVISGAKPSMDVLLKSPSYIKIDHQSLDFPQDPKIIQRIAMVSLPFSSYSSWNGKGRMVEKQKQELQDIIDKVHQKGKKIRFWGTPDGKTAWKAFYDMGIDVINTDSPFQVREFFDHLQNYMFENNIVKSQVYTPTFQSDNASTYINKVILLIGDGNGLSQISAAAMANGGDLTLLQLKSIGLIKTQASDDFTTDSAAAGTALATGEKTFNRSIGMSQEVTPLQNITQRLSKDNFLTGIVSTDEIVGATPSAFYAHQSDRDYSELIAKDLVSSELNLFIGGGAKHFDKLDITSSFTILPQISDLTSVQEDKVGVFLSEGGLKGVKDGRGDILAQATSKALDFLNNKGEGFFLMVEGAKIDTYGHFNNTAGIITEGIDFDKAIAQALQFADKDGHTLVVVTADHETGGFAIPQGDIQSGFIQGDFITNDHTGSMVPIFAYGPHSSVFQGVYENTQVYHKIIELLQLNNK